MASLSRHGNGWLIQYMDQKKRKSFYPGVMPARAARQFLTNFEHLLASRRQGTAPSDLVGEWLSQQGEKMRAKLHRIGLIERPVEVAPQTAGPSNTIAKFAESYIKNRSDAKDSTKKVWKRCLKQLVKFFGPDRTIESITVGDSKDFRQWMLREGKGRTLGTMGMEENTVRKMCSIAAQIFTDAVDRELILRNPFTHKSIPRTTRGNRTREFFVTREMADRILEACPDAQWKLLFALSRYGGLRCPSEHISLKWTDILWDQDKMIVTAPKTEHHEGKETRVIPIFREVRPHLEAVLNEAEPGEPKVITRYRSSTVNLRTQLHRIIRAAGLTPWPKTFHNLRASRETELAAEYPIHVVCSWIGNSPVIAARHYLTVTELDFKRAQNPMQNPMQ